MERYYIDSLRVRNGEYPICDRKRTEPVIAVCDDPEIAIRIVNLLNADVERVERQGARVA